MPEAGVCGYWKLSGIVQPRINEGSFPVHFEVRHKSIPICQRAPARPSMEIHPGEPEGSAANRIRSQDLRIRISRQSAEDEGEQ